MKKFKKVIIFLLTAIMLFALFGLGACRNQGYTVLTDDWTIFRHNNTNRLVGLRNQDLVIDGVLTIPKEVDGMIIHGFGRPNMPLWWGGAGETPFNPSEGVKKIVIPTGIYVDNLFIGSTTWLNTVLGQGVRYVEFLCGTFDRIFSGILGHNLTFIIPDSSREMFSEKFRTEYRPAITFYEKSQWLALQNN